MSVMLICIVAANGGWLCEVTPVLDCFAVWPTGNAPAFQAVLPLSNVSLIFGQTTATAHQQTGIASFNDLYMHAPNNIYAVQFATTSDLVSISTITST